MRKRSLGSWQAEAHQFVLDLKGFIYFTFTVKILHRISLVEEVRPKILMIPGNRRVVQQGALSPLFWGLIDGAGLVNRRGWDVVNEIFQVIISVPMIETGTVISIVKVFILRELFLSLLSGVLRVILRDLAGSTSLFSEPVSFSCEAQVAGLDEEQTDQVEQGDLKAVMKAVVNAKEGDQVVDPIDEVEG